MDKYLRDLERMAASGSEEDLHRFLLQAYRAGYYRQPKRKEIQKILRRQRKKYGGAGMLFSPRFHYPGAGKQSKNAVSNLQHPDEVSEWSGDYGEWNEALKGAMPGDVFEINTYYREGSGQYMDWNLSDTITMDVPDHIYLYGDKYYGPPPEFKAYRKNPRYRRNADERIRGMYRKYQADNDIEALRQYVRALHQIGELEIYDDAIIAGIARGFFIHSWQAELERRGLELNINAASYALGLYHYAPPTPADAVQFAITYIPHLLSYFNLSLSGCYAFAQMIPHEIELDPEFFGQIIANSAQGQSPSFSELYDDMYHSFLVIPRATFSVKNICDSCGRPPEPTRSLVECGFEHCQHEICVDCRETCADCEEDFCDDTCILDHNCSESEEGTYDQETGDITTEDFFNWYQYGKLYFQGNAAELRQKMDEDNFYPSVYWVSDHGNISLITEWDELEEEEDEEDEEDEDDFDEEDE